MTVSPVLAANVSFSGTTNVYITDLALTLTIVGTTNSIEVDSSTVTLTMCADCEVIITSADKKIMNTDKANTSTICNLSNSTVQIYSTVAETVVVTPTSEVCTYSSGGSSSTDTTSSGGGGGGTTVVKPSNTSVKINDDADKTSSLDVTLTLAATNATLFMVSNNADFTDVSVWENYTTSRNWTLSGTSGSKTVYAKFRSSSGGESSVVSDSIIYEPGSEDTSPDSETAAEDPLEGKLVKGTTNSVYVVDDGLLRPITSAKIFEANGYNWSDITVADLSGYSEGDAITYPEDFNFTDGMTVKGTDAKVYAISEGKIRWLTTEDVFLGLNYKWSNIYNISDARLATYTAGEDVTTSDSHPDGVLVKYADSSKVYLIEGAKKRWIVSEQAFNDAGYQWTDILEISAQTYEDGDNIGSQVLGVAYEEKFVSFLSLGSTGDEVRLLQQKLKDLGYLAADVNITGYFGNQTKDAVMKLQQANGINPVGYVGPTTRQLLNSL